MAAIACPLASRPAEEPSVLRTSKGTVDEADRPDIAWIPSLKTFRDRVDRLQAQFPNRRTTLPAGWPARVDGARAWVGEDFKTEEEYVVQFGEEDVKEIEAGLAHFKGELRGLLCELCWQGQADNISQPSPAT